MELYRFNPRRKLKPKRPTRITIPERVCPHVKLVFAEMSRQNITYDEVEIGSGILRTTVKAWRHKNAPGLTSIEAVLGFLGWDFVPVPRAAVLPKALLDDLAPIAERHALTMPKTIQALIEIVTGIHANLREPEPAPEDVTVREPRGSGPLGSLADTIGDLPALHGDEPPHRVGVEQARALARALAAK